MEEIQVNVKRESVCMGDDVNAPHALSFKVPSSYTFQQLFSHLSRMRYLAGVAGNEHSWEAIINGMSVAVFKQNNKEPEESEILSKKLECSAANGTLNIWFKYNSSAT